MRISKTIVGAAAMMGAVSLLSLQPAAAAPMMPSESVAAAAGATAQTVQYRHGYRGGYGRYGYGHRGYGHRGWGPGYGAGAALGGLAAGAIIGGAIANSRAQELSGDGYCAQRFKSYDPASGTYLGYDGNRHSCP